MYRVFGCGEAVTTSNDVIIQALTYAFFDGVDVMSLSLGGASGWKEGPDAAVASRVAAKGIPVYISAGNDGADGALYASNPVAGKAVTGVGAVDNLELAGYSAYTVDQQGASRQLVFLTANKWNTTATLPVKALSTDPSITDDGCDPAQVAKAGDLTGSVVVVGRGTCTFVTKINNVAAAGAKHVLIYNTPYPNSVNYPASPSPDIDAAALTRDDGIYLLNQIAAGAPIKLDFSRQVATTVTNKGLGGLMSSFSTTALPWELDVNPQISAPGGNILSTWPLTLGKYAIISGTSMSCPFVAGSAALYRGLKGKSLSATEQRAVFSSTAKPVTVAGAQVLDTVAKQGGGLIDVYRAVMHTTEVSPGQLALNDTRYFGARQTITVSNKGTKSQTYKITHTSAGTLTSVNTTTTYFNIFPVPISGSAPANVAFSKTSLTIPAGKSATFTATFTPPRGLDPRSIPLYSGFINLKSDAAGSLSVPYAGVADDLYTEKVLDTTAGQSNTDDKLPLMADTEENTITDDKHVFTLKTVNDTLDSPSLYLFHRVGYARESLDLVFANTTFKPTVPIQENGSPASSSAPKKMTKTTAKSVGGGMKHNDVRALHHAHATHVEMERRAVVPLVKSGPKFSDVQIFGNLITGSYAPRDIAVVNYQMPANITTNNGTGTSPIADGEYRLLYRVSKLFNDLDYEGSYESYLSHKFTIKQAA